MKSVLKIIKNRNRNRKLKRKKPDIWYLPGKKIVYIQLRKVASRSFKSALSKYISGNTNEDEYPSDIEIDTIDRQYSYHPDLRELNILAENNFSFTCVRNPLDRLYSCYTDKVVGYREKGNKNILEFYGINFDMSFCEFVKQVATIPDNISNTHFRSQHCFLYYKNKLLVDEICYFENLSDDWNNKVRSKFINMPRLPTKNSTRAFKKISYVDAYTPETFKLARLRYQTDIELLGYGEAIKLMESHILK